MVLYTIYSGVIREKSYNHRKFNHFFRLSHRRHDAEPYPAAGCRQGFTRRSYAARTLPGGAMPQ